MMCRANSNLTPDNPRPAESVQPLFAPQYTEHRLHHRLSTPVTLAGLGMLHHPAQRLLRLVPRVALDTPSSGTPRTALAYRAFSTRLRPVLNVGGLGRASAKSPHHHQSLPLRTAVRIRLSVVDKLTLGNLLTFVLRPTPFIVRTSLGTQQTDVARQCLVNHLVTVITRINQQLLYLSERLCLVEQTRYHPRLTARVHRQPQHKPASRWPAPRAYRTAPGACPSSADSPPQAPSH